MAKMKVPASGARIRMYRQGHGDCFLLAFRKADGSPFYMLIDCGLFPGSKIRRSMKEVALDIQEATGGRLDLVVITHEHMDHVSGFRGEPRKIFAKMHIDECWVAWTEDRSDRLARRLRKKYKDTLLGLVGAARQLRGARGEADRRTFEHLKALLAFEIDDDKGLGATIKGITNKKAMKFVKDKAAVNRGTRFLSPHKKPESLRGVPGVRVFVLGPPRRERLLKDMEPRGDEEFHVAAGPDTDYGLLAGAAKGAKLSRASEGDWEVDLPFGKDVGVPEGRATRGAHAAFFRKHYRARDQSWRRIDRDWLRGAEQIALRMSNYINNTSLVLAFELPQTNKVLLFVGDAQRGNWISWHKKSFRVGNERITAEDLLNRTVLYKVGHHGSHNATMKAKGLDFMAKGEFANEFVAMIPANKTWAFRDAHWRHPLPAIYSALREKARGRVLMSHPTPRRPRDIPTAEWKAFVKRTPRKTLYYEYEVDDT